MVRFRMERVFANLIANSMEAVPADGISDCRAKIRKFAAGRDRGLRAWNSAANSQSLCHISVVQPATAARVPWRCRPNASLRLMLVANNDGFGL